MEDHMTKMKKNWIAGTVAVAAVAVAVGCGVASAQNASSTPASPKTDISGLWLLHDPGSGDWSTFFENVPKAELTPAIIQMNKDDDAKLAAGHVVNTNLNREDCGGSGGTLPMMMGSSPPLNIVQSKDEILIGTEANRGRIVFMDGRKHPDLAISGYVPNGFGHSIGHWESDTLVVDTTDFAARVCDTRWPVMRVPGYGRAKDTTHLVERYKLLNGGKQLSITFTWEDPTIYLAPHTYTWLYDLVPNGLPEEPDNDLSDAAYLKRETQSVIPPRQN